ncbi:MAG: hypothetical protein GF398_02295 [Chitinivibrionales bacterium]|nr:hypothetical protein [Chitinivibrionales bacterium]
MVALFSILALLRIAFGKLLSRLNVDTSNRCIIQVESKLTRIGTAASISLVLLVAAGVYVRPALHCHGQGAAYAKLAEDPFDSTSPNPVGYRRLTPTISYVLGLRGRGIIVTNVLFAWLLLSLMYLYFRAVFPQPVDAFLGTAVIGSSLVVLTTLYYGGYCDALTYIMVLGMWRWRANPVRASLCLALGLLNHESTLFAIPWLVAMSWLEQRAPKQKMLLIGGIVAVITGFVAYRLWLGRMMPAVFTVGYYMQPLLDNPVLWIRQAFLNWWLGFFTVFKLNWAVVFCAALMARKAGERRVVPAIALIVSSAGAQLLIAYDTSRMLTLAFPAMLPALEYCFKENCCGMRGKLGWIVVINLAVPQLYTASYAVELMVSPLSLFLSKVMMQF